MKRGVSTNVGTVIERGKSISVLPQRSTGNLRSGSGIIDFNTIPVNTTLIKITIGIDNLANSAVAGVINATHVTLHTLDHLAGAVWQKLVYFKLFNLDELSLL